MPSTNNNQPPEAMTWGRAVPVILIALIFDALRLMFEMFWFFGPALAALYCTAKVSGTIGTTLGGAVCTAGAGVAGFFGAGPIAAFGVVMGIAVGLLGWMTLGLILIMTNARLFTENTGNSLWFMGSLLVSEVPIIGVLPALTGAMVRLYRAQIKSDAAAIAQYEKKNAAEQIRKRTQQAAQLMQAEQGRIEAEEAANAEQQAVEAEQEQKEEQVKTNPEKFFTPPPSRTAPKLASVPDYGK